MDTVESLDQAVTLVLREALATQEFQDLVAQVATLELQDPQGPLDILDLVDSAVIVEYMEKVVTPVLQEFRVTLESKGFRDTLDYLESACRDIAEIAVSRAILDLVEKVDSPVHLDTLDIRVYLDTQELKE